MSRATRNSKVLRSGAIGFLAGLATLGVVAHGSPARGLIDDTTSSVRALTGAEQARAARAHQRDTWVAPQEPSQSTDPWLVPQEPQQPYAQPQYQQPQVQPAPSQQPQSQAS